MRGFIIKVLISVLIFIICITLFFFIKPNQLAQKFSTIDKKLQIINLGTSHGNSFRYELLDLEGGGFCKAGNTLYYDLQSYRYLKPHLADSAVIVIPLSYFTFGVDENRTDNGEGNAFVNDFYRFLPKEQIFDYSFRRKIDVYANDARLNFFDILYSIQIAPNRVKSIPNQEVENLYDHSIKRARQHKRAGEYRSPKMNIKYLKTLVKEAKNEGFKPVLVVTPFYNKFNEIVGKNWLQKHFYEPINEVRNTVDVPFLDYSNDIRFRDKDELFFNSDHLNTDGKIYFSQIFFDDLRSFKLLNDKKY